MSSGSRWRTREDIERDMGMLNLKEEEPQPIEEEDLYGKPNLNLIEKHIHKNREKYHDERLLFKPAPKPDFNLDLERKLLEQSDKAEAKKKQRMHRNVVLSQFEDVYTPGIAPQAEPSVPELSDFQAFPSLPKK